MREDDSEQRAALPAAGDAGAEPETSDPRFGAIIDATPVPMALNDEEQRITFLNSAFVRTFGYTQEDIPTLAEWWPKAYPDPDYREWVSNAWQVELARAKRTGTAFTPMEFAVRGKDGTTRTVLASAASLAGSFRGTHLVVLYDISERKSAEAERTRLEAQLHQAQKMESIWPARRRHRARFQQRARRDLGARRAGAGASGPEPRRSTSARFGTPPSGPPTSPGSSWRLPASRRSRRRCWT